MGAMDIERIFSSAKYGEALGFYWDLCFRSVYLHDKLNNILGKISTEISSGRPLFRKSSPDSPDPGNDLKADPGKDRTFSLDSVLKEQFERAFNTDFSDVRIHTGAHADELTNGLNADAVVMGSDIYFKSGQFAPHTEAGMALLAHELSHVVQNQGKQQMVYLEDVRALENEAEKAEKSMEGLKLHHIKAPYLDGSGAFLDYEEEEEALNESVPQFPASGETLESFRERPGEPVYKIFFQNSGKTYYLTETERELVLEKASVKLREYVREQMNVLPEVEREAFVMRILKLIHRGGF